MSDEVYVNVKHKPKIKNTEKDSYCRCHKKIIQAATEIFSNFITHLHPIALN